MLIFNKIKLANSKNGSKQKMNSKKNAFTLIELLAIIVILAIIAVITVPIILNIIENSKMGAATDSAYGYRDAVNKYYVAELANNGQLQLDGEYTIENGVLKGDNIEDTNIPVSGTIPSSGTLTYSNNTLTEGCLVIGEYAVTFDGGTISKTEKSECKKIKTMTQGIKVGNVQYYTGGENLDNEIYFDPTSDTGVCTNYTLANSTTGYNGVKNPTSEQTSCLRWFIYSIDDKGTASENDDVVNMILDHNTTKKAAWAASAKNFNGPDQAFLTQLTSDTNGWTSNKLIAPSAYTASWTYSSEDKTYTITYSTNARLIEADEVAKIKGDSSWTYTTSSSSSKTNNYQFLQENLELSADLYGYWTSSPHIIYSNVAWSVDYGALLTIGNVSYTYYGVRPVISVLKSDIL